MGYKIALWFDTGAEIWPADVQMSGAQYPGYARAVNTLIAHIMSVVDQKQEAQWFVTGGDDVWPDPKHKALEIAFTCADHFSDPIRHMYWNEQQCEDNRTMGVMQPTGDRWHEGVGGFQNAPIDRVCGSPWMGREFCRRINQGNGPLWHEYEHMYVDEELQNVAEKYGILWQRRDLVQKHQHWGRGGTDRAIVNEPKIPEHLKKWNSLDHWRRSKGIFEKRKLAGFPGSEPIA